MVNVGELLETVNLSADLLSVLDGCKHDALRDGAQYILKLISLALELQFLRHRDLVSECDFLSDVEVDSEAHHPVANCDGNVDRRVKVSMQTHS